MRRGASPDVQDFVQAEGDLLDRREFETWLDLFADDAYYWVPLSAEQEDPLGGPSHIFDSKDALLARVLRLRDPQNVTQQPPSRYSRVIGRAWLVDADRQGDDGQATVLRAPFQLAEALPHHDADVSPRLFAGTATWCLTGADADTFRIKWKRVDLINSEMGLYGVSILI